MHGNTWNYYALIRSLKFFQNSDFGGFLFLFFRLTVFVIMQHCHHPPDNKFKCSRVKKRPGEERIYGCSIFAKSVDVGGTWTNGAESQ